MFSFIPKKLVTLATISSIVFPLVSTAQRSGAHDHNSIGWYQLNTTTNLGKKWGLHMDYNQRYEPFTGSLFQRLIRPGINFKPNSRWHFRAGYVWVENRPYGDYPANTEGRFTNEHRSYQMAAYRHQYKQLDIRHRVMTEQRWLERTDGYQYANRIRYQVKAQVPVKWKKEQTRFPYLQVYDEIMVAFGKNIPANRYDQNRLGMLAGYHFSKNCQLETGVIHIHQQLQRKLNNQSIFLHNTGLQVNLYVQVDSYSKAKRK